MSISRRWSRVDELVKEGLQASIFPGAVLLVRKAGKIIKHSAYGLAMEVPETKKMEENTIFDLASLTKVVVTTTLAMLLLEQGRWKLDDPVSKFLPEVKKEGITIRHLLTHTSGLPAWVDLFSGSEGKRESLKRLYSTDWPVATPAFPPGERVVYSDLGFIILGQAIERAAGEPLDVAAKGNIFQPLGMTDTTFNPPNYLEDRIAATELDEDQGNVLVGEVHDENARALGGVSGHAGLFSTARDLGVFAQMLLNMGRFNGKKVMCKSSVALMSHPQTEGLNERRALGWKLQGESSPSAGDLLSDRAFGHTGFTGTSIWIDPKYELAVILLTNRVHPSRNRGYEEIQDFRARMHNCIIGVLDE